MKISFKSFFLLSLFCLFIACSSNENITEEDIIPEDSDALLAPSKLFDLTTWNLSVPEKNGNGTAITINVLGLNSDYQNENYFSLKRITEWFLSVQMQVLKLL